MNILITGSKGFIGSNLLKYFQKNGHNVTVLKRSIIDISEEVDDIDCIYHCAAKMDRMKYLEDPFIDVHVNINGLLSLFEACKKRNPKVKIIYLSSFLVEKNVDMYSNCKLFGEELVKMYNTIHNMNIKIARLTNVIGTTKQSNLFNYIIKNVLNDKNINIFNEHFMRDYVYIDDVVNGLEIICNKGNPSEIYYLGSGVSISTKYLLSIIISKIKSKSKISYTEATEYSKKIDIVKFNSYISNTKLLGWKPKSNINDIIDKMIELWSEK